jgi:threonine dehydratase
MGLPLLGYAAMALLLAGGVAVDDTAALAGVAAAFADFKVVAEPSGAIGLGALLAGAWTLNGGEGAK